MTTSATRRFIDLFGEERLEHGARRTEFGLTRSDMLTPFLNGKESFILSGLYPQLDFTNPYVSDGRNYYAFRSGCAIERADLADVVGRCRS